jgi:hypothetical protein
MPGLAIIMLMVLIFFIEMQVVYIPNAQNFMVTFVDYKITCSTKMWLNDSFSSLRLFCGIYSVFRTDRNLVSCGGAIVWLSITLYASNGDYDLELTRECM